MTAPYYQDDSVTLYHGDCIDVMRTMPDNSIDSIVTDPPYNLSTSAKRDKQCLRDVLAKIQLPDNENTDTKVSNSQQFSVPPALGSQLGGVHRTLGKDTGIRMPEGSVDLKGTTVVKEEIHTSHIAPTSASDGHLPLEEDPLPGKFDGNIVLQHADGWDATLCNGTCSCFTEPSPGFIAVPIVATRLTCSHCFGLGLVVEGCDAVIWGIDHAGCESKASPPVHTGAGTVGRAVLRLDLRGGTGELDLTDRTLDTLTPFQFVGSEFVGAGAGTGGLSAVAEPYEIGFVGAGTNRAFTLYHVAHINHSTRGGFMGKQWDGWENPAAFQRWCTAWTAECLRVLKPGGHLLAFGGSRTWHRLAVAVEDAGFEIRDSLAWLYGSGFSKGGLLGNKAGLEWCECGPNALPYNHAHNADLPRVRQDVHPPAVARSEGQDAVLLAPVQRRGEGQGVGQARTQGQGGMVAGGRGVRGREDARGTQPGMGGRVLSGAGQGLPHGAEAGAPEGQGEWLRGRAPVGHGGDDRASGHAPGGSAPHQPGPGGQPTGEPEALPGSHEPLDDGARRGRVGCPRCGGLDPAFRGFSTTLKPAFEPIVMGRKPFPGSTVAGNVLQHGTGALNIDATRIRLQHDESAEKLQARSGGVRGFADKFVGGAARGAPPTDMSKGRWPANVLLDESQAAALDQQSGTLTSGGGVKGSGTNGFMEERTSTRRNLGANYSPDTGGASRFFYCAKAPKAERPNVDGVQHPTVKPLAVMRWLLRLVTPPGGTTLDTFAGSGATVEAALLEGFRPVAIEREAEYLPLTLARVKRHRAAPATLDFGGTP